MRTINKIKDLRATLSQQRQQDKRIAFVPTMGNLHAGHIQLVQRAKEVAEYVVTSIFVNPLQFGADEDLNNYPRTLEEDKLKLVNSGNNLLFTPNAHEMYPKGLENHSRVSVPGISEEHCGISRPGHFDGVATVVTMLFNMVQPDIAIFGEKDFQQLAVIRKLTKDLCLPIEIEGVATIREKDGLAMSSRNGYLSDEERKTACKLYQILTNTKNAIVEGCRDFSDLTKIANESLIETGFKPDYYNIVNSRTLLPAGPSDREITILAAVFASNTRLIDNISISL